MIELTLIKAGIKNIAGVDEAGRGPCAGPLVVACVILKDPLSPDLNDVKDSKELSPKAREDLYKVVVDNSLAYSIIEVSVSEIDSLGLHKCNIEGMRRAINALSIKPEYVLTDGYPIPGLTTPNLAVWKGDQVAISISAASILAKVYRDKIMNELSEFLGKYKNSSYKGQFGENQLESVLNQMFPSAEILNTTGIKASCDFRVNRLDLPTILFETKNYDRNVTLDEVKKFIRDIEEQKCHGIFLSQHSGITSKQNFQIDIKGSNVLVYVHNVDYCPQTIKIATDIIDSLSYKLAELEEGIDEIYIPKEIIEEMNLRITHTCKIWVRMLQYCLDIMINR